MTDITALALIAKIKKQTENFDTVVLKEWEALALVEALEKAQQRTVTFKLTFTPEPSAYSPWIAKAFYQFHRDTVKSCFAVFSDACAAAGIKVEAE